MNLKQIKYVTVLADQGSFSKAAEELNISQPSLSQYVRKIEDELGVSLFDRSGNVLKLTDAGKVYLEAGRSILDIERRMKNEFADIRDCRTGTVTIGVSPHRSICVLPPVIAEFHRRFPGMQIIIDERVGQELLEKAEKGEYDLCVTTLPVDEDILEYELIKRDGCVLAVPTGSDLDDRLKKKSRNRKNGFPSVEFREVDGNEFIALSDNQVMQKILDDICKKEGVKLNKTVICRSLEAELALVKEGIGPALLPSSMLRDEDGKVSCYSLTEDVTIREIVVAWRKEYKPSKAVRELIDIMKEILLT